MKWFAIGGIALTVLQVGIAVPVLARHAGNSALQPAVVTPFPSSNASADALAWVLDMDVKPRTTRVSIGRASSVRSNSIRSWSSVANRNGNPLNVKLGSETRRYVDLGVATVSDVVPADGGRFLKFASPQTGFTVALALLSGPAYDDLSVDQALRRWSNNGYGAEILPDPQRVGGRSILNAARSDLEMLLRRMAAAEGYKSATMASEIEKALSR